MLLTGKGARAREIAARVEEGVGLYWILKGGEEFVSLWGNDEPTSELHAHLAIHDMLRHTLLGCRGGYAELLLEEPEVVRREGLHFSEQRRNVSEVLETLRDAFHRVHAFGRELYLGEIGVEKLVIDVDKVFDLVLRKFKLLREETDR